LFSLYDELKGLALEEEVTFVFILPSSYVYFFKEGSYIFPLKNYYKACVPSPSSLVPWPKDLFIYSSGQVTRIRRHYYEAHNIVDYYSDRKTDV